MAQEVQTECHSFVANLGTESQGESLKTAFSPAIVEIGFIDEEADDIASDISELSISDEDKRVHQDSTIRNVLPSNTEQNGVAEEDHLDLSSSGLEQEHFSNSRDPQDHDVPSHLVPSTKHSPRHLDCAETDSFNEDLQTSSSDVIAEEAGLVPREDEDSEDELDEDEILAAQNLEESIIALQMSFEDKSTLGAFEKLNKRKEDEPMEVAKKSENAPKNRYKDVLPYDESRVSLNEGETGDYINASFVNMNIPSLEITNEYIATQGPLPNTCDDFWQMVWEQKCGIIVMVTTLMERNRSKCHKYWPDLYETITQANIQISCFSEGETQSAILRDFLLVNENKNEDRHVIQIQYVAWPDHGVPEDATDFLEFVQQLREWRKLIGGKVAVHCSAGVGRTGVLILMETVMCFIESGYPVHPLKLVKTMRDQRVMMVQTVGQYKFICEAILKLYNDHRSKFIVTEDDEVEEQDV